MDLLSEYDDTLKDGFWPMIRVAPSFEDEFTEIGIVCEEYDEDKHFIGRAQDCPVESFWINWDLYEGYFVAVWPSKDDTKRLLWIPRAF